ncbi:MAG: hypothetical protein Q7U47_08195 [Paludibacter sp.]|nr:hypothetical protein [Paludibacter sp.]
MNSRLLIIHPEGNIKNNPNLFYFTKELVNKGYAVTLFSRLRPGIYQGELFEGAEFVYFTSDRSQNLKVKKALLKQNFCHIIGIDDGIIEAAKLATVLNIPYSFLSYEIFFDHELIRLNNPTDLKHKRKAIKACRRIQFAIVQDRVRKQILSKEYDIDQDKILLMPVAGTGIRKLDKTDYFHKRLQIPADKKILLYMGWMDTILLGRIVDYVAFIPENWVLVVHSRYKYDGTIPVDFPSEKIYFSLDSPVESIDDMGILLSGCDAGFCSYQASYNSPFTGDNITYIGLSSGKTTTFLQYGIPVVVENMNLWDEIVEKEQIGIVLVQQSDLNKLDALLNESMKKKCFDYFEQQLDLKNYFYPILEQFESKRKVNSKTNVINYFLFLIDQRYFILKNRVKKLLKSLIVNHYSLT